MCVYLFCVFVCLCAAYHKDVPSFGGACLVKMTHLLAGHAHMCFCCMFKYMCVFVSLEHTAKIFSFLDVCVVKLTHR